MKDTRHTGAQFIVELTALRPHSDHAASALRDAIPATLAGLVDEVPAGEVELRMWCGADAMVRTTLRVAAQGVAVAEILASEIARLLDPAAERDSESALGPNPNEDFAIWPIVPASAVTTIGYTTPAPISERRLGPHRST